MRCANCTAEGTRRTSGSDGPDRTEGRLFASVLALGALFGLMTSPCARAPFAGAFVIFGVPLLTFAVAAPGRLSALSELRLLGRDTQAGLLAALLTLLGRRRQAGTVLQAHRADVERAYAAHERVRPLVEHDPLRLHHARRLGMLGATLAVAAGVLLPLTASSTYTWGSGLEVPVVIAFDLLMIGAAARLVSERIAIRLFEATTALSGGPAWASRLRTVPLVTLLGGTLGAIGSLVVLFAASAASGLEAMVLADEGFATAALWFLRATAPMALTLGIATGVVMGAGAGLAQTDRE
jgi:hypothetical protein